MNKSQSLADSSPEVPAPPCGRGRGTVSEIYVLDIEADDLYGPGEGGRGRVLEIGVSVLDLRTMEVRKDWSVGPVRQEGVDPQAWIFTHRGATLTYGEVMDGVPIEEAVEEYRKYIARKTVVSLNMDYDFRRFLDAPPWSSDSEPSFAKLPDPMVVAGATGRWGDSYRPYKWPKAEEAYAFYYPDSSAGYSEEKHRALDDSYYEAWILKRMIEAGEYSPRAAPHDIVSHVFEGYGEDVLQKGGLVLGGVQVHVLRMRVHSAGPGGGRR